MSYPRIGYAPYSPDLTRPGDKRRFAAYARARNLPFELARPGEHYDIVVLTNLADISYWADYQPGKIVYDLVDSYLAIPRYDPKQLLRGVLFFASGRHRRLRFDYWKTIVQMCRRADAVVCATDEQRQAILAFCPNVHVILDIQDDAASTIKRDYRRGPSFNIVWEGLASNLQHLRIIGPALRELSRRGPVVLNVVTDPERKVFLNRFYTVKSVDVAKRVFDRVVFHRWDTATFAAVVTACDLAVIPINLGDPLAAAKSENKLLLFWRLAMPVVTSATPSYVHAQRTAGLESMVCRDETDWINVLERLMKNDAERRNAGEKGLAFVTENFQTSALLARWDAAFSSIGFDVAKPVTAPGPNT